MLSDIQLDCAGCAFSFLFVPDAAGIAQLLQHLGLGDAA
jgi:hypothetical protein